MDVIYLAQYQAQKVHSPRLVSTCESPAGKQWVLPQALGSVGSVQVG